MILVAFSGRAASGKSTLARAVSARLSASGRPALVVSFAEPIKKEVWEKYGLTKEDLGGREAIIRQGDQRRLDQPLYWCRKLLPIIESAQAEGISVIVDDLRFPAEASFLRARGFYLVRVVAPAALREFRLEADGQDPAFAYSKHPTETALAGWSGFDLRIYRSALRRITENSERAHDIVSLIDKKGEEQGRSLSLPTVDFVA